VHFVSFFYYSWVLYLHSANDTKPPVMVTIKSSLFGNTSVKTRYFKRICPKSVFNELVLINADPSICPLLNSNKLVLINADPSICPL